jgi:hypothetical protein
MPGRLSRCFTGRWNENRFREAEVKWVVAVWRLQETGVEGRDRSGGRSRFRNLGQQSAPLGSRRRLRVGRCVVKSREQGNNGPRDRRNEKARNSRRFRHWPSAIATEKSCQAVATAHELTASLPALHPQFRNSLWSGPLQPSPDQGRRIVPLFRV